MAMKTTDRIVSAPRGSIEGAKHRARNAKRKNETMEYIDLLFEYAVRAGVDPAIAFAQWDVETNTGQSGWWENRLNPAGIGITGWEGDDNASWFFSPITAAKAQIAHLLLYATGTINKGGLVPADDPRYDAYINAYGSKATATTIQGLAGRWAVDKEYANTIVKRSAEIWPELGPFAPQQEQTQYAPIVPILNPDGSKWTGDKETIAGTTVVFPQRRTVRVVKLTKARRWGTFNADSVADDYQPGDTFTALGYFKSSLSNEVGFWWVTEDYHRVWAGDTYDQPFRIA